MLSFLPHFLRGSLIDLLLMSSTLCWAYLPFGVTLVKPLLPFAATQRLYSRVVSLIAEDWTTCDRGWMNLVQRTRRNVRGLEGLEYQHSYLVTSNHRGWVDILTLQYRSNRHTPLLRFLFKQELIQVPIIDLCWWTLDFLFMRRYSKAYLAKHPEKGGQNLVTMRGVCTKFSCIPVTAFNSLEGAYFTRVKCDERQSPFRHLPKPKAGGVAFVLDAVGERLEALVNVTIHYPDGSLTFWCLFSGCLKDVVVHFEELEIPRQLVGKNHDRDASYHAEFQQWVNQLWEHKD